MEDTYNSMRQDDYDEPVRDREISLGAATIFGIFLGLTLVCALFFGLGFTIGRRSAQPAAVAPPPIMSPAAPTITAANPHPKPPLLVPPSSHPPPPRQPPLRSR